MRATVVRYLLAAGLLVPAAASAAEAPSAADGATAFPDRLGSRRVVSGWSPSAAAHVHDWPDIRLDVGWRREDRRANLARERGDQTTGGSTTLVRELTYRQIRQVLTLGAEVGLLHDLSLAIQAPWVLADDRWLHFDDGIDAGTSTLLRDGILPGAGSGRYGLDAEEGRPFDAPSSSVFRGPTRRGLEYLGLALSYALMNQRRDPTRPTWLLRLEPRLALGKVMSFDPSAPDANRGVNPGYHQVVISTSFSRRMAESLPLVHLGGFWSIPWATSGGGFRDSPLGRDTFGAPQHRAGAEAGLAYEAFTRPQAGHRLVLELSGLAELRLAGLARSELWEPLSGAAGCPATAAACRPQVDVDLDGDGRAEPYPGLVRSPAYGRFGGELGAALELARVVRLRAAFAFFSEQDRLLSDGRSGVESFDRPGRRFRVDDARSWHLGFDATAGFD